MVKNSGNSTILRSYRRFAWSLLWLLACGGVASAQGKAFVSFKPELVETGDTFILSVLVSETTAVPKSVDFASWTGIFPAENMLRKGEWKHVGPNWIQQFTLIYFDSATLALPPLSVLMQSGKPIASNAAALRIYPTRGAELSEMEPVREIIREPESWMDYWPWALGAVLALVALYLLLRPRRKPMAPVVVPTTIAAPSLSPLEIALAQLSALEQKQLWKQGQAKEHQAALSLIVREYLENQYKIPALESTTREIIGGLSSVAYPAELLPLIRDLLQKMDLVKYARSQLSESEHLHMLEKVRELLAPNAMYRNTVRPGHTTPPGTGGTYQPL